jgi:hypothetical protein
MSDTNVTLPNEIILRQGPDKETAELQKQDRSRAELARAVVFIDKTEGEKFLLEARPQHDKLTAKLAKQLEKLQQMGRRVVATHSPAAAEEVKAALKNIGFIGPKVETDFNCLDPENQEIRVEYKVSIKESTSNYRNSLETASTLTYTDDMIEFQQTMNTLRDEIAALEAKIIEAEYRIRDRANRLADAEGMLAIKHMSDDDKQTVKTLYEQMRSGVSTAKLLNGLKS